MLNNHLYNLMSQMVQEHRSLWRIKNEYKKDVGGCSACKTFWEKLEQNKEDYIKALTGLIKNHLD